jgi:hypothetical protein
LPGLIAALAMERRHYFAAYRGSSAHSSSAGFDRG